MSYFLVLLTACGNTDVKTSKASLPPAESNIDTSLKAPNWVEKSPIQQSLILRKIKSTIGCEFNSNGDNLYHDAVIKDGKQKTVHMIIIIFMKISKAVKSSDLAIVNQETPIAGNNLKVQGYPTFNTPEEVGQSLVDTGFNIVTQATNHAMDMGIKGVANTREYWKKYPDVIPLGINESQNERNEIKRLQKWYSFCVTKLYIWYEWN